MAGLTERLMLQSRVGRRSDSFRWLWEHHDEVAGFLANKPRRPWVSLAATIAEHGLQPGRGEGINRKSIREAWLVVEAEWAKATPAERSKVDPPAPQLDLRSKAGRAFQNQEPSGTNEAGELQLKFLKAKK